MSKFSPLAKEARLVRVRLGRRGRASLRRPRLLTVTRGSHRYAIAEVAQERAA